MTAITIALMSIVSLGSSETIAGDPSFYAPSDHAFTTAICEVPPVVLDDGDYLLLWDTTNEEFVLEIDGEDVDDLVTFEVTGSCPRFEGDYDFSQDPQVFGTLIIDAGDDYSVELTVPNELPMLFEVTNEGGETPIVTASKRCDCDDKIGLTCQTPDCNAGNSCSADTATCIWVILPS